MPKAFSVRLVLMLHQVRPNFFCVFPCLRIAFMLHMVRKILSFTYVLTYFFQYLNISDLTVVY